RARASRQGRSSLYASDLPVPLELTAFLCETNSLAFKRDLKEPFLELCARKCFWLMHQPDREHTPKQRKLLADQLDETIRSDLPTRGDVGEYIGQGRTWSYGRTASIPHPVSQHPPRTVLPSP